MHAARNRCRYGHACPFATMVMLEGNSDTVTIPAKKTAVQTNICKSSCIATDLIGQVIEPVIVLINLIIGLIKTAENSGFLLAIRTAGKAIIVFKIRLFRLPRRFFFDSPGGRPRHAEIGMR